MRGSDVSQESMFTTIQLETFVERKHPLRKVRALIDEAMKDLHWIFERAYDHRGRASIPPERMLRAMLLQVLYSIRSERQLSEQINYNMLFRWFVGLTADEKMWDHSTFSKNRARLLEHDVIPKLFAAVIATARRRRWVSDNHFSVDGTLLQAWASQKSFKRNAGDESKDDEGDGGGSGRNGEDDFQGETRLNDTHESTTDPESRLYKKSRGGESKLAYLGHTLMENRNGLIVDARASQADGYAERCVALEMLKDTPGEHRKTVGADKNYDTADFVATARKYRVTPHVAMNTKRAGGSALDGRTYRHEGYAISQRIRKRIEEGFGWAKSIGQIRQVMWRGLDRVDAKFKLTLMAWNLMRMSNLQESCA